MEYFYLSRSIVVFSCNGTNKTLDIKLGWTTLLTRGICTLQTPVCKSGYINTYLNPIKPGGSESMYSLEMALSKGIGLR